MLEKLKNLLHEKGQVQFNVKIVPGSSRSCVMGELGESAILKIKIAAPPEKGKANAALIDFLSETFNVPARNIQILSGHTSPLKTIEIQK